MKKRDKIEKALLKLIPINKAIYLGDDVFLTGMLDGADKIYGFINEDGKILVEASTTNPYSFDNMDKKDIDYIYGLSVPNIYSKIKNKQYPIIEIEQL